jgi:uncharacterized integral membrane protein (TIGR00698 family)
MCVSDAVSKPRQLLARWLSFPVATDAIWPVLPGLGLSAGIAGLAFALRLIPGVATFSPMILAVVLGIAFHNLIGLPAGAKPGITFALKRVLRFAIVLLGVQLTAQQIADVGFVGVSLIAATLVATFIFTKWFGSLIGVERKLAELIAAGTSICGASAIIATNAVTEGHDEDVAYAVACVTVFGSIAMFVYPALEGIMHLGPWAYGLWSGASIHEIAQVVAAAFQAGKEAGEYGTIAKLTRVTMLAPGDCARPAGLRRASTASARFVAQAGAHPLFRAGLHRVAHRQQLDHDPGCGEGFDRARHRLSAVACARRDGARDRRTQAVRQGIAPLAARRSVLAVHRRFQPVPDRVRGVSSAGCKGSAAFPE